MIQSNPKSTAVHVDPLSFLTDIEVLSGNLTQNFNAETNEYEPDRTAVPLLLMPYVSSSDPSGDTMNGPQEITSVEWYEGAPNATGSNRISVNDDRYAISDVGCPPYSLKVKKNEDHDRPIEYFAVYTILDKRTNTDVQFTRSKISNCSLFDSRNYSLKIDKPKGFTFDPTRMTTSEKLTWLITTNAQLYSGKEMVPDTNAAYFWQVQENGLWREINPEEDFFCETDKVNGQWGKTFGLDARLFDNISIRCISCYYEGDYPVCPTNEELSASTTINVEMPKTLSVEIIQTKGIKMTAGLNNTVAFSCRIFDNNLDVTDKTYLFDIRYLFKPSVTGAEVEVGRGLTCEFNPANLGITVSNSASVRAVVRTWKSMSALFDTDGESILTDTDGYYYLDTNYA